MITITSSGQLTTISGPVGSGKTKLALEMVAEAQRKGGVCAYIDSEHAFNPTFARELGVDVEKMLVSQPDTAEQAGEIAETFIKTDTVSTVILDSVNALISSSGELGGHARLVQKLNEAVEGSNTTVVLTLQTRESHPST